MCRALELYPNQTSAYINGALAHRKLKQFARFDHVDVFVIVPNSVNRSVLKFEKAISLGGSSSSSTMAYGYMGSTLFDWYNDIASAAPPSHLHNVVENATAEEVWTEVRRLLLRQAAKKLDNALVHGWTPPSILYSRASIELEMKMHGEGSSGRVDAMDRNNNDEGSWDIAIRLLEMAIENNRKLKTLEQAGAPTQDTIDEVVALNQLGLALWKSGRIIDAEVAFLNGINLNPWRYELMVNLGSMYRDNSQLTAARDMFGRAMGLFTSQGNADPPAALLNNAGLIELDLGNMGLAADLFRKALHVLEGSGGVHHPYYASIRNNLLRTGLNV